jgi:hypothetical protein
MPKPDQVHELISSLTASEKRYVSLFASRHIVDAGSNQLRLFEAMVNLKVYDEKLLLKRLGTDSFSRHLSSEKNQLFRTILLAMRVYHEEHTVDSKLRELLTDAEFLFEKRLYNASIELLKKAGVLAEKHERRTQLLEMLQMEANVIKEKEQTLLDEKLAKNHARQSAILDQLNEEAQLIIDRNIVFLNTRKSFQPDAATTAQLPEWINEEPEIKAGKSFNYNFNRLSAIAIFHSKHGRHEQAADVYELLVQLWENYPERELSERLPYKKMLANNIVVNQLLQRNEKVEKLIAELKKHPCHTSEEEAEQFQVTAFAELMLLMNIGQWEKLENLVRKIEEGLNIYKTKINKARELAFRFNIGICWFVLGNWKASVFWLNEIIDTNKTDHRRDIQQLARIFRLLLYFELDKHDLLEYELINAERYLRQHKAWSAWEASIVRLIKKTLETDMEERPQLFSKFIKVNNGTAKNYDSAMLPGSSEILLWAKSHVYKRSIRDLMKEER